MKQIQLALALWLFSIISVEAITYGVESGRIISNNPTTKEAKLAEAVGPAAACKKTTGSLSLVQYRGKNYLLGAAHPFYKDGKLRCTDERGIFVPDFHYRGNDEMKFRKKYYFKLPPLNHKTALKFDPKETGNKNLSDIAILELLDDKILTNQLGKKRTVLDISEITRNDLLNNTIFSNLKFISNRKNFHERRLTSYEEFCSITNPFKFAPLLQHRCDTGQGSSGAPLIVELKHNAQIVGLHIIGSSTANLFIPSEYIIEEFERTIKD